MEKKHFPELLVGERLELRKHRRELAGKMFAYVELDRERLREYLPFVEFTKTVEDEIEYIESAHAQWLDHKLYDYGLFRKSDGEYMGNVGVHNIAWNRECCEIGYWILGKFEGQGFMSEAVDLLTRACFEVGFNRVEIRCSSTNVRSETVPRRLGFTFDALLPEDDIVNGVRSDTLIFSALRGRFSGLARP